MRTCDKLRKVAAVPGAENAAHYEALAVRAATGEFDDYADVHICGPTALYGELMKHGFKKFADRVAKGEFDATRHESEVWARSQTDPEVINTLTAMGIGPDRSKDQ